MLKKAGGVTRLLRNLGSCGSYGRGVLNDAENKGSERLGRDSSPPEARAHLGILCIYVLYHAQS